MDKITNYDLATGTTVSELAKQVKGMMQDGGWEPLGAPISVVTDSGTVASGAQLVQAMVIYKRGGPA